MFSINSLVDDKGYENLGSKKNSLFGKKKYYSKTEKQKRVLCFSTTLLGVVGLVTFLAFFFLSIFGIGLLIFYSFLPTSIKYDQWEKLTYKFSGSMAVEGSGDKDKISSQNNQGLEGEFQLHCLINDQELKFYYFQANIFNLSVFGYMPDGSKNLSSVITKVGAIGEYVFFNQTYDGVVTEILKPLSDDELFPMKVNMINAFTTSIKKVYKDEQYVEINGIYNAVSSDSYSLSMSRDLHRKMDQSSITEYSESDIKDKKNFVYEQETVHRINYNGKISKIEIGSKTNYENDKKDSKSQSEVWGKGNSSLILTKIEKENIITEMKRRSSDYEEKNFYALMILNEYESKKLHMLDNVPLINSKNFEKRRSLARNFDKSNKKRSLLKFSEAFEKGNLYHFGKYEVELIKTQTAQSYSTKFEDLVDFVLFDNKNSTTTEKIISSAKEIIKRLKSDSKNYEKLEKKITFEHISNFTEKFDDFRQDLIFYILCNFASESAQNFILNYGFLNEREKTKLSSIVSSRDISKPQQSILDELIEIYKNNKNKEIVNSALLSYAVLSKRTDSNRRDLESNNDRRSIKRNEPLLDILHEKLVSNSLKSQFKNINENHEIIVVMLGLMNANFSFGDLLTNSRTDEIYPNLSSLLINAANSDKRIKDLLFKSAHNPFGIKDSDFPLLSRRGLTEQEEIHFPYNKSDGFESKIGGKYVCNELTGYYFVGSDYFCYDSDQFNLKAKAEMKGEASLFGSHIEYLYGLFHFEDIQGSVTAKDIRFDFLGVTLYSYSLPDEIFNCTDVEKPIYDKTFNLLSLSYTIVIVFVPVTFDVDVDVTLRLTWGYSLCLPKLYASVFLKPYGKLVATGAASINLFLIKGGVCVDCGIDAGIKPEASVDGIRCRVNTRADWFITPFTVSFDVFYQTRDWDMSWGKKHKYSLWDYSMDQITGNIWNLSWEISQILRSAVTSENPYYKKKI